MELITRTVYGSKLQTAQLMGLPLDVEEHTTLNEKFNIHTNLAISPSEIPRMQYVSIGNGGHVMEISGTNSMAVPKPIMHRPTDAALYAHLPFILRPVENDIAAIDRQRYALRKVVIIDSQEYIAYYLRRMNLVGVVAEMQLKNIENNIETTTPFVPTAANLTPVPPVIVGGGSVPTTGDFVLSSARINFNLDNFDMEEIQNAANIIYGSPDYAIISEIGLCSGVERTVAALDFLGSSFNYDEVIACQICTHISTFHALRFSAGGINTVFDVGATEPLYLP
jgi:hypothetical protein